MPEQAHLAGYLEAAAERYPTRTAVVDPDGTAWSYEELNDRAERMAAFLVSRGVAPGDRVGLLLPKSAVSVASIFGILKARAAYVPVDWTAPAARVWSIFGDCNVSAVIAGGCASRVLAEAPVPAPGVFTWEEALAHPPARPDASPRDPGDLAYILYTSGSTGVPKGVMLTQQNATSFVDWCSAVFTPDENDRFSSHAPFHFDLSVLDIYLALKHGASLHLVGEELGKNPRELAQFIAGRQLTVWYSTPSILSLLAEFGNLRQSGCRLRLALFAGEVFPIKHLRRLMDLWPHPAYYNLYGPTETNVCTFARIPSRIPTERTDPYPIGRPCAHCLALVLNAEGAPVERGEEGLLYISGPSLFQGYWNRPKENAAAFLERGGIRWYNTGDVVREDGEEGFIYIGRRDRMVKRRGYRIELGDIETGLYRHPEIREAAVVALPVQESGVRIIAYLAANPQRRPSIVEMKTFCARQLPSYMSPDVFVFLDALPRTSTNKADYQSLIRHSRPGARNMGSTC